MSQKIHRKLGHVLNRLYKTRPLPAEKIVSVNGYQMLIHPRWDGKSENGINKQLFFFGNREYFAVSELLRSGILQRSKLVLDVGANMGFYTLLIAKNLGSEGIVYAVEPCHENYKTLILNINLNGCHNILPYELAFGSEVGSQTLFVDEKCNLCTLNNIASKRIGHKTVKTEEVKVVTVDRFFEGEKLDFMRMDVEGFELEILEGAKDTLETNVALMIEVHNQAMRDPELFFNLLKKNNFYALSVIYENKVLYPLVINEFFRKGGNPYPLIYRNLSIEKLKRLIQKNSVCPNVIFRKHQ